MDAPRKLMIACVALLAWQSLGAAAIASDEAAVVQTTRPAQGLAAQLSDALNARGWTLSQGPDGSLHYRPPVVADQVTDAPGTPAGHPWAERIRDQLTESGWNMVVGDDGSVFYHPPELQAQPVSLAERLRSQLEGAGWISSVGDDGSMFFSSPRTLEHSPQASDESGESLADGFRQMLETQGWTVAPAEDGSVDYLPPKRDLSAAPGLVQQQPAASAVSNRHSPATQLRAQLEEQGWTAVPTERGGVYYLPPQASRSPAVSLAERLRDQLQRHGWIAFRAEDGSIIYRMPEHRGQLKAPAIADQGALAERLRQTLEAQGWTAKPADDGSVYYLPPGRGDAVSPAIDDTAAPTTQPEGRAESGGQAEVVPAVEPVPAAIKSSEPTSRATPGMGPDMQSPGSADAALPEHRGGERHLRLGRAGVMVRSADDAQAAPMQLQQGVGQRMESKPRLPPGRVVAPAAEEQRPSLPMQPGRGPWGAAYPPRWQYPAAPPDWRAMPYPSAPIQRPVPWGMPPHSAYPYR